jgi:lipoprotein NlpI
MFRKLLSSFVFILLSFASLAQTVNITQPNGGEVLYSCQQYPVRWTQSGSFSDYWNIDYSLDGGIIWASITSNFLSTNGQFMWTVPNVTSTTALIRVRDAQNASAVDISNNTFTINTPVILTSPTGGEIWQGLTTQQITWNAAGTSNTYDIHYSKNGGSTWIAIVTNYSSVNGIYNWTVPNDPASSVLVRVMDRVQNCMQDISNPIQIVPAQPILTFPNGGEELWPGCAINITWDPATFYSNVRLDYSTDNGTTWTPIVTSVANNGSRSWTVPVGIPPSNNYIIKAANTSNLNSFDVSDNNFTILPPIDITRPRANDTLVGCSNFTIRHTSSNCIGDFRYLYSIDGGVSFINIGTGTNTGNNNKTYVWSIPNPHDTIPAVVRVERIADNTIFSESQVFTLIPSNEITVTSPAGGEQILALTNHLITWTNTANVSGVYEIHYSTNNGSSWTLINNNVTGNAFNWAVPNIPSSNARIRIRDKNNICKEARSPQRFTIVPAQPVLLSPNGGEVLWPGCSYSITWDATTFYSSVKLEYSADNGATWVDIVTSVSNTGSRNWVIPSTINPGNQFLIRASNTSNLSLFDVSDNTFTVPSPITVTRPNVNDALVGCQNFTVRWTKSTCLGNYSIQYSIDNGANFTNIINVNDNGSNTQTQVWQVPNGITSNQAIVRVISQSNPAIFGLSEVFSIQPSQEITVTAPSSGTQIPALSNYNIEWTNTPNVSGTYEVHYSVNNGSSWTLINNNVTGNAFVWSVPNSPTTIAKIRVRDKINFCKEFITNTFEITPTLPLLTFPNGGEELWPGCNINITWDPATFYSTVRLDYSSDNGVTWNPIFASVTNNGTRSWTVPTAIQPGTQYIIKAANTSNLNSFDISDNNFTILPPISITRPRANDTLVGCSNFTIRHTSSNCIGDFRYLYSIDGGVTFLNIGTGTNIGNNNKTYVWSILNPNDTIPAIVRVERISDNTIFSESPTFTLIPSNEITVTSPAGGEQILALTNHLITWTNTANVSGVYEIHYSTNNGSSWTLINNNVTGNAFNWTVPNIPTANARIRIRDKNNTCKEARSPQRFTILPAQPVLLSPNGGEVFWPGCSQLITWDAATFYSNVKLEYSADNGTNWIDIVTSVSNTGSRNWVIPSTINPGNQFLIRASNTSNLSLFDVSDNTFTVPSPITVTRPNVNDALVGCQNFTVRWTKSTCIGNYSIQYSIDNGANFTNIINVNDNGSNTQTQVWQVPNEITSNQAIVRVISQSNPAIFGLSEVFSIQPSQEITVTAPSAGTQIPALSNYNIEWTNTSNVSGAYEVHYSTNNGLSWTAINTNITGNALIWSVPNVPTTSAKIRVRDRINYCKEFITNTFEITPAQPVLLYPNGGEELWPGCAINITWDPATFYSSVRLDYSTDNGTTWTPIITSTTNNGTRSWTIPTAIQPGTQYIIRAANTSNLNSFDISDNNFTILPPISITRPTTNDTLVGCSNFTIRHTSSNCIGDFRYLYSIDGGVSFINIGTGTNTGNNNKTYVWSIPNPHDTIPAVVRVERIADNTIFSESQVFTLIPSNEITVTSPAGGEQILALTNHLITWTNTANVSGVYEIHYSINNGSSWILINNNVTGNAFNWSVPNNPSVNARIRVRDKNNTCKEARSPQRFTIVPAQPILIYPNGGEILYSGTNQVITWDAATFSTNVKIEFSLDGGNTWNLIVASAGNTGLRNWTVPNESSTTCLVRVSSVTGIYVEDVSDAFFTIKPAVRIITPNGDPNVSDLGGCTVTSITFERSPAWNQYVIEYTADNGNTWININNNWTSPASNIVTYNWTLPNIETTQARVRVTPRFTSFSDESDNNFNITKPVTLIQPNFGGIVQAGTVYNIIWSSDGISNIYDIFYSTNGGSTWQTIEIGYVTSNNTYAWTVPNTPSNNTVIKVRDNIDNCKDNISANFFTISTTPPPITLTSPNGLDTIQGCSNYDITWTETNPIGTYDIAYSTNSGNTWTDIVTNYSTNQLNYNWAVPNINSNTVLVRVRSSANANIFDLSDALFTIERSNLNLNISDTSVCAGVLVQLSVSGGTNYTWSPSAGLSCNNCNNPIASPNTSSIYYVTSSNGVCSITDSVIITITGDPNILAEINISSSAANNTICEGENVVFTANPDNEGNNPVYQWYLNDVEVGTNSATYQSNNLSDDDEIKAVLISDLACVSGNPASSNVISMTVNESSNTTVSISASKTNICEGENVDFLANIQNNINAPNFQWKLNGNNVGTDSIGLILNNLNNADIVSLRIFTNDICALNDSANANEIVFVVNPLDTTNVFETACESFTFNNQIYTTSGIYNHVFTNANNCDSTVILDLTINNGSVTNLTETACDSFLFNGNYYTQTGNYSATFQATNSCDSVVNLDLTINNSVITILTQTACDSYELNGQTYTQSGTYFQNFNTASACDSVVRLDLVINNSSSEILVLTTCESFTFNNQIYTSSGIYNHVFTNANNCDSTVILDLTINNGSVINLIETACDSFLFNGNYYTQSGNYSATFQAANACDSVVNLDLTINNSTITILTQTACDSYELNGQTYTQSGTYFQNFNTASACDSVVRLDLVINNSSSENLVQTACESFTFNNQTYTTSGIYNHVFTNTNNCDSTVILDLTINNGSVTNLIETACDSFLFNGNYYTQSGNYSATFQAANACDSVVNLDLTINNSALTILTQTACDSYELNGQTYTQSGTYFQNFNTASTCDSVVRLDLVINNSTSQNLVQTSCESFTFNNQIYTSSGIYNHVFTNANNCDSTVILDLTINNDSVTNLTETACDSFLFNGNYYSQSGNYSATFQTANTCDSVVNLDLTINNSVITILTQTACESFELNGQTYTQSGTYFQNFNTASTCDSVVRLDLVINNSTSQNLVQTACESFTFNNQTYTSSGIYNHVFTNVNNCDSTVILDLTINNGSVTNLIETACDSFLFNGNYYTQSGNYSATFQAANTCDSVVNLDLTINNSAITILTQTACDSYEMNGQTYTQSGTYFQNFNTASACDSVVRLDLVINNATNQNLVETACESFELNGQTYTQSGIYNQVFNNQFGCLSTVTLDLTIIDRDSTFLTETACETFNFFGTNINQSGTYFHTLSNSNTCDSVIVLNLTINQSHYNVIPVTACNSYSFNGQTYFNSGIYVHQFLSSQGCDSTVQLNLLIDYGNQTNLSASACESYTFNGVTYNASGIYNQIFANEYGCDSTFTLNLTIFDRDSTFLSETSCEFYDFFGTNITQSGTYFHTLNNNNGCDSVIVLNLTINNAVVSNITQSSCDSFTLNGQTYSQTGNYSQTFQAANGCDSIVNLNLTINNSALTILSQTACESYDLNGQTYTQSGTYFQNFTTISACDSVVRLDLVINNASTQNLVETACGSYHFNGNTYFQSGIYIDTLTSVSGCDSIVELNLEIYPIIVNNIVETACESYVFNGINYTQSGIYTAFFLSVNGCDSTVVLDLTINNSVTTILNETACGEYILNGQTYTQTGIYIQNFTTSTSCDSIVELDLTIENIDASVVQNSITLTANSNGLNYQWINCANNSVINGENNQSFVATANGDYAVIISSNNCSDTSNCFEINTVGIDYETWKQNINLYPNPTRNDVNINISGKSLENARIRMYDFTGKEIYLRENFNGNNLSIEMNEWNPAIYFLEIVEDKNMVIFKVVKQ